MQLKWQHLFESNVEQAFRDFHKNQDDIYALEKAFNIAKRNHMYIGYLLIRGNSHLWITDVDSRRQVVSTVFNQSILKDFNWSGFQNRIRDGVVASLDLARAPDYPAIPGVTTTEIDYVRRYPIAGWEHLHRQ